MCRTIRFFSIMLAVITGTVFAAPAAAQGTPAATVPAALKARIQTALPAATGRGVPRFTLISLNPSGELAVIYKVQAEPTIAALRDAANADQLAILRAIFAHPQAAHVHIATVVGTYAISQGTSTRELPIVMTTLSAARAQHIDWAKVRPNQLAGLVDVWWLHPALAETPATPAASPAAALSFGV